MLFRWQAKSSRLASGGGLAAELGAVSQTRLEHQETLGRGEVKRKGFNSPQLNYNGLRCRKTHKKTRFSTLGISIRMVLNQQGADPNEGSGSALLSAVVEDASIQAGMQPWVDMECYQLSRGRQLAQMDILDLGTRQIVRESQAAAVQKLGVMPSNLCTLSYCTPDPNFRFSEFGANEAAPVFFLPAHTEYDIYVPTGAQTGYVSFNQEEFLADARTLNPENWEKTPEQLQQLQTAHQTTLKSAISLWFSTAAELSSAHVAVDETQMRKLLLENILQVTASSHPDESPPPPVERSRALHICRMARIYVEESLAVDVVPTVTEICRTIDVSERALQYAFRAYVDMSPVTYLRLCRLNRVRATLRVLDPQTTTVTAVAMRFGFLHLGRFAQDYRQVFDESPSATLAS